MNDFKENVGSDRPPVRAPLNASSRRSRILELLKRDGQVTTGELARTFSVSAVTIHRDLETLADSGDLERVHGGARTVGPDGLGPPTDWNARRNRSGQEKRDIADLALTRVESGSIVFLDASTSCLALAHAIARRPPRALSIVTNSPLIAAEFHEESVNVIVTPGELDQNARFIGGPWTTEFVSSLRFQSAFISAAGLTLQQGLGSLRRQLADLCKAVSAASQRTYALVDSSKFGTQALLSVGDPRDLDELFTDSGLDDHTREEFERAGVNLAIAHRPPSRAATAE